MNALFLLPLLPLTLTILNLLTWTRGRPHRAAPRISVLIPARNEAGRIGACLEAVRRSELSPAEILVYDDHSTDTTAAIVAAHAADDSRVRLLTGGPLPTGWVGKPHACSRLAEAATGEWLVYLDADVELAPEGLGRVASLLSGAAVVTAVPRQKTGSFLEHLVLPLLHVTYLSWLPLLLVEWSQDPRFTAANGQILGIRANALREIGGFAAVKGAVVDDMALCRLAKARGWRVCFADGFLMGSCRMYQSAQETWEGFSKNLHLGVGSIIGTVVVIGLYLGIFLLPLVASPFWPIAAVGATAVVLQRLLIAWRYRQHPLGVLLHPVAILIFVGIALNSLRWVLRRDVRWRGRSYDPSALKVPG